MPSQPWLKISTVFCLCFCLLNTTASSQNRAVDVVFCMDLSGSTNGLIDDLRDRMWDIILQFQAVKPAPVLRIGMVAYSRPSYGKATGYVKVISPLTDNFDQLSYDLFNIKPYIEKGDQLVGAALQMAVKNVNWSKDAGAVKMIFIVGNGSVELGPVNFRAACEEAVLKNIVIHPVFCTRANKAKEITGWLEIARLSGTETKEIFIHKRAPVEPVCTRIPALRSAGENLMKTYLYYGENGYNRYKLFKGADASAMLGGVLNYEARMYYKNRYLDNQSSWDLVDFIKVNGSLPAFDHNSLADSLKMMPDENLLRVVLKTKDDRSKIIAEMNLLLPSNRPMLIKKQIADMHLEHIETLECMVVEAYLKTMQNKGFAIE